MFFSDHFLCDYKMHRQPRQKKAEIQRLSSISNLKAKQLASSVISKGGNSQQEAERIEHYDLELRPSKLQEMKQGEVNESNAVSRCSSVLNSLFVIG
ncbi:hypothetical protein GJ496_004798 [Pomphorhynchus laevis]|nr:hypothetical protein GJ496_004798 [Pomphorhynchus laevis]